MHHIKSIDIPTTIRYPYLEEYRRQLKQVLQTPGMPLEQQEAVRAKLKQLQSLPESSKNLG